MQQFKDAVALISGAASGIGAAVATRMANSSARKLILVDTDEDRLHDFAFSLPCERALLVMPFVSAEWAAFMDMAWAHVRSAVSSWR